MSDAETLDRIAKRHLGEMAFENPSSSLESIMMLVEQTGRSIEGWDE